jgi:hypothetical protein
MRIVDEARDHVPVQMGRDIAKAGEIHLGGEKPGA